MDEDEVCPHCHTPIENPQDLDWEVGQYKIVIECPFCDQRIDVRRIVTVDYRFTKAESNGNERMG